MKITRVKSIDWLRGLMAISIMVFHLTWRIINPLDSDDFLGRLGIYGVSIFFVLSGLSIATAYSQLIKDLQSSIFFITRRLFRIWPLLWICTGLTILQKSTTQANNLSIFIIILNITATFGFVRPDAYISMGAWSVGSEMVYYILTPIIILIYNKNKELGDIILAMSFLVLIIFCFFLVDPKESLVKPKQWCLYINPLNNLFLYIAGISLFYNLRDVNVRLSILINSLAASLVFFIWYPASGNLVSIVTGFNRLLFITASILLIISFYKFSSYEKIPILIFMPLQQFGTATYGIYLLHPLVMNYLIKSGMTEQVILFTVTISVTIILALLSYNFFELNMINLCKKITILKTE